MRNRLIFRSKNWLKALCLLLITCGTTYSCSDNYDLDTTTPGFLGGSIYSELKNRGEFTNVIKLIDDLDYAEVLDRTGSKTLFVAGDSAFTAFFASNDWKDASGNAVRSYEQLSQAQKRLLLYSSMLDNAYLTEMLTNVSASNTITKNVCLRQANSLSLTDSVPVFNWADLPKTNSTTDVDLWGVYNNEQRNIRLALDNTVPMMLHFINGQMNNKNIKASDFFKIVGQPWTGSDVYIYKAKIQTRDITCLNGYVNKLDRVLVTPANMAEVIRTNGRTNLFSHVLDRFSAPTYDASLTSSLAALTGVEDSVFVKRYYSTRSAGGGQFNPAITNNVNGSTVTVTMPLLSFDPGWNVYYNSTSSAQEDMAAMFVPNDDVFAEYFLTGGGRAFVESYSDRANTADNLLYNVDQIPLNIMQALINNLMKASFNESVPSKYLTIKNDARDDMFSNIASLAEYEATIDTVLLANNGAVYITNRVHTPAAYAAVTAPVLYSNDTKIVNAVVTADDDYVQGTSYANAPLKQYFSTYLKAMQSNFSFFVPTDASLGLYVDPATYATASRRYALEFTYTTNGVVKISSTATQDNLLTNAYKYDAITGQKGDAVPTSTLSAATLKSMRNSLLVDMVNHHIVIHTDDENYTPTNKVDATREYYLARNGAPIHVRSYNGGGEGMLVEGGFQRDYNETTSSTSGVDMEVKVERVYDQTEATNGYGNGMTYVIDRPMQATMNSVYYNLITGPNQSEYSDFAELCNGYSAVVIENAGFLDSITGTTARNTESAKYNVFSNTTVLNTPDRYVRFLNNYNYTLYVPNNTAMAAARANGLPTWDQIAQFIEQKDENSAEDTVTLSADNKAIAQAMVTCLVNFVKYHFQDRSVFDDLPSMSEASFETSSFDRVSQVFIPLKVKASGGKGSLSVTDVAGNTVSVTSLTNVFARDMQFNGPRTTTSTLVNSSAYSVIHQLNGYLNFQADGGRFDNNWTTASAARNYVKRYQPINKDK